MLTMPVSRDPLQTYLFPMEGVYIRITLRWNPVGSAWSMDLARDGVDILRGQRVLMGTDLLRAYNLGLGAIIATATLNEEEDATEDDLGERVQLVYLSEAERDDAAISP